MEAWQRSIEEMRKEMREFEDQPPPRYCLWEQLRCRLCTPPSHDYRILLMARECPGCGDLTGILYLPPENRLWATEDNRYIVLASS